MTALISARTLPCRGGGSCNGRKLPGPEMSRIPGLERGSRLGVEGSPGAGRLVTDSAEGSNLTGRIPRAPVDPSRDPRKVLENALKSAKSNLASAQQRQKSYADRRRRDHPF
eukprot:jgi/Botrbrau1/5815/Bobra.0366s0001.1